MESIGSREGVCTKYRPIRTVSDDKLKIVVEKTDISLFLWRLLALLYDKSNKFLNAGLHQTKRQGITSLALCYFFLDCGCCPAGGGGP